MSEPAPRWGPEIPLGARITRVGRWRKVNPLRVGRVWGKWEWGGLLFYIGLVGYAFRKARAIVGSGDAGGSDV